MSSKARSLKLAMGGLLALATAMGIGRFVYTPILPYMIERLGLTPEQSGLIASANYLGYLLGAMAATWLPGVRGFWFALALAISAATTFAMGMTEHVFVFILLRAVGGVASALVLVFGSALVLDRLASEGRPELAALYFAGVGSGIAFSAVLVSLLAMSGLGWDAQWLASGGASLLFLLFILWLVPLREPAMQQTVRASDGSGANGLNKRLVALISAYGLFGFGYVITATFISAIARDADDFVAAAPFVWLVAGLAAAPSVALWGWIARRTGYARAFAAACVVEAIGVALSVLAVEAVALLVAAALLGGTFVGITALGLVFARDLSRGDPRRSIAVMTAVFGVGQVIGPLFAGYAYRIGNSFVMPSLAASLALLIAAVLVWRIRWGAIGNDREVSLPER